MEDWKDFQDTLPNANPSKISVVLQGIICKTQLNGQAADHCAEISKEQLKSTNGVDLIVNTVYLHDFMSVISEAYDGFSNHFSTRRGKDEYLKGFEACFPAAVAKFDFFSETTKLPQFITAFMALNNALIEDSHRVSVLSAAAPNDTIVL